MQFIIIKLLKLVVRGRENKIYIFAPMRKIGERRVIMENNKNEEIETNEEVKELATLD